MLAGGSLSSPRLLLASSTDYWPDGCGNASGLVGRGLMFHINERIAIWPPRNAPVSSPGPLKTFSLRDLYRDGPDRMGLFQSLGLPADYGNILYVLRQRYQASPFRHLRIGHELLRLPALTAAKLLGDTRVLCRDHRGPAGREQRVRRPHWPDTIIYEYRMSEELLARRLRFRRLLKRRLRGVRSLWLSHAPELGTIRASLRTPFRFGQSRRGVTWTAIARRMTWTTCSSPMPASCPVRPG